MLHLGMEGNLDVFFHIVDAVIRQAALEVCQLPFTEAASQSQYVALVNMPAQACTGELGVISTCTGFCLSSNAAVSQVCVQ